MAYVRHAASLFFPVRFLGGGEWTGGELGSVIFILRVFAILVVVLSKKRWDNEGGGRQNTKWMVGNKSEVKAINNIAQYYTMQEEHNKWGNKNNIWIGWGTGDYTLLGSKNVTKWWFIDGRGTGNKIKYREAVTIQFGMQGSDNTNKYQVRYFK